MLLSASPAVSAYANGTIQSAQSKQFNVFADPTVQAALADASSFNGLFGGGAKSSNGMTPLDEAVGSSVFLPVDTANIKTGLQDQYGYNNETQSAIDAAFEKLTSADDLEDVFAFIDSLGDMTSALLGGGEEESGILVDILA